MDVPEYQPLTERQPIIRRIGSTEIGPAAPITISTPFGARPPSVAAIASALVTVAMITFAPPSLLSSAAGSDAVDVMRRTEFFGKGFLVLPARDRHGVKPHVRCKLNAKMTKSADAEHCNNITTGCAAVSPRVECRHSRTHQRRAIHGGDPFRHK